MGYVETTDTPAELQLKTLAASVSKELPGGAVDIFHQMAQQQFNLPNSSPGLVTFRITGGVVNAVQYFADGYKIVQPTTSSSARLNIAAGDVGGIIGGVALSEFGPVGALVGASTGSFIFGNVADGYSRFRETVVQEWLDTQSMKRVVEIAYAPEDGWKLAAYHFYGQKSDRYRSPVGDLNGLIKMSADDRHRLAEEFDHGLSRQQAILVQAEIFQTLGYSRADAYTLSLFREALKFGDQAAVDATSERVLALNVPIPDIEERVWAFCFSGDTKIALADGTFRRIDQIAVGDVVLAYSETNRDGRGPLVPRRVVHLFRNLTDEWIELSNGVTVTPGHLFLTADGSFESIERILADRDGMIVAQDGTLQQVTGRSVRFSAETAERYPHRAMNEYPVAGSSALAPRQRFGWVTYNFEVEDLHTYVAGGMRVHNMCIDQETQLTVIGAGVARDGHQYTQIAGYGGETYTLRNDNVYFEHGHDYAFEKLPDGSDYAFKRYDPTSGVTFYYTEERMSDLGYNPTQTPSEHTTSDKPQSVDTGSSGSSGSGGGSTSPSTDKPSTVDEGSSGGSSSGGSSSGSSSSSGSTDKPVLIDLDGDGIEITPLDSSNFYFDMAGDGMDHRTAWAGAGDGVLVRDAGNDGIIENRNEVDFTDWDSTAQTDMQALRNVFDTNHDGKLDASDADWSLFKVLVTNPDGTTTLKTMAELGITSINLISDNQQITLPDGSKILGTTTYTRSDGSTGTAADTALKYDANGYIVTQTVTTNPDGSTTIVNKATRPNGSLASETVSTVSADGKTRSVSFDNNGDGVVDRVQTDVTVVNGDGSITNTLSDYDGSGTILLRRQVTLTSADRKTVTVSRDLDGSGNYDQVETRVTGVDGSLTLTVTQLNADGTTRNETTTITSADGHSKTTQVELTGSGAINASRVETTAVAGDGTRTETLTNYAGDGTAAANRVGGSTTVTSADGTSKTVSADLDGNATVDLSSESLIVHNANGSTTTTVSRANGDTTLRDRTIVTRSADGNSKTTAVDADGNGSYDLTTADVTVFNADGSTTRTITDSFANGSIQDKSVLNWSADGKTRSISVDSDGDGAFDRVETVAVVGGNSVDTVSIYSANGTTLLSKSVTTTSANGLSQTVEIDANADGSYDSLSSRSTTLNPDGSSTVTVVTKNGAGTVQIGKTVTTTSADGLSITAESYQGTQTSSHQTTTSVTVRNVDGSTITTAINYAGTSQVQTARSVTTVSADRLTTSTSSYVGTNVLPESVVTTVTNADGSKVQTVSSYGPNGATLLGRVTSSVSADGLSTTVSRDLNGDGVVDATDVSAKVLNADGTVTTTTTTYAGSSTAAANRVGQTLTTVSASGLVITTLSDANGEGTFDAKAVDTTTLNADGSRTQTVVTYNGAGTIQTGKSVTTVSDDGLTKTVSSYIGNHTVADTVLTDATVLNADGSTVQTLSLFSGNGSLQARTITTRSGNGLSMSVATDLDGNGVNDRVEQTTTNADGSVATVVSSYGSTGTLTSRSTQVVSGNGLSKTISTDLDGNGTTDQSQSLIVTLNADGSRTETLSNFKTGGALRDKTVVTTSADGLSVTTQWDATGSASFNRSKTDVSTINADGSVTRIVSNLNANGSLHDRTTTTTSADGRSVTSTEDVNGDGTVEHTLARTELSDGSVTVSAMDGVVQSASGRLYGSTHGRYETTSADGLVRTIRFDANGDGLAENQVTDALTLNADGSTVRAVVRATLSGGIASSADPAYAVTVTERSVKTTSADGLSAVTQLDLTGSGTFGASRSEQTVLNADGSKTTMVSHHAGAVLKSRSSVIISADGQSKTTQLDSAGTGAFTETATDVTIRNADGSTTQTITNTDGSGGLVSKVVATTSADGRTKTIQKDMDGSGAYEETQTIVTKALADGTTVVTKSTFAAGGALKDRTIVETAADGTRMTVSRDANGDGIVDQTEVVTKAVDGSSSTVITDWSGAGVKTAQLTTSSSADGLSLTTQKDNDGDGIIDRTTGRTVTYNADGSTVETTSIYKVSEKAENGTVTVIAPVLQKTITVTVSADRRTTISSVDIDGNGSADEVATTVTRIDGSSITTTTANAAARAIGPQVGEIEWSSVVATTDKTVPAVQVVTVSADGLTRTVQADYDGNGTYEHTETWKRKLDGSQLATISDVNAGGAVLSSGTLVISADGLTTTLSQDTNADAVIDHKETLVSRADGSKIKTIIDLAANGTVNKTVVATISSDGQTVTYVGTGGSLNDTLIGADGKDSLSGAAGSDILVGGGGVDILDGGDGDDYLEGGKGADQLIGGNGSDVASYANATAAVRVELGNAGANTGEAAGDTFNAIEGIAGSAYNDTLVGLANTSTSIWAGAGNDVVTGGSQNDYLLGEADNDTLFGGDGNDQLVGGAGADILIGGAGSDTASYAGSTAGVRVYLGNNGSNTGDAAGDKLTAIENITGSAYNDVLVARQAPAGFFAEYFAQSGSITSMSQIDWNATPTYVAIESDATWGTADRPTAVFPGGPADYVAARHSGSFDVTSGGMYTFYSASDDGSQVYIDGVLVVNNDGVHDYNTTSQGSVNLAAGRHRIEVRYFENTGATVQWIEWSGPGVTKQVMNDTVVRASAAGSGAIAGLLAEYFVVTQSTTSLSLVPWDVPPSRVEVWAALDKNFGTGAIYAGGPSDYVAIRLTGAVSVTAAGTYTFYGASDDGTEIYVDGVLVTAGGGVNPFSGSIALGAGTHRIEVRYLEYTSPANLKIEWSGPNLARQVLGQAHTSVDAESISSAPATLDGGAGNDVLTGGVGGDILLGGAGIDTLNGGVGDDVLVGGAGSDVLIGGSGNDIASYADAAAGVTINTGNFSANTGDAAGDTYNSVEAFAGSQHADTLIAGAATAFLYGENGNDLIYGGAAADYLNGGAGGDVLTGAGGADILEGGDGNDQLDGGADNDAIRGGAGDDQLTGGAGADTIDGGDGNDEVSYLSATAAVTVNLASPTSNTGEALSDTLVSIESVRGTNYRDFLLGNAGVNNLFGAGGDDDIHGREGNDFLYGMDGHDRLAGGAGADYLDGGAGADEAWYADATAAVTVDFLSLGSNSGFAAGDTYVSISNIGGSEYNDMLAGDNAVNDIWGNGGNDNLRGRGGNDTLRGNDGDDRLFGGEGADVLDGGAGWNEAAYWEATSGVTADLATPSNNTGEAAGDTYINIYGLSGSGYGDTLRGNWYANSIWGGLGNDTLDGGAGTDTMYGGAGDDTYIVDSSSDSTVEIANEGTDLVLASANCALPGNVENLTLTGTSAINGYGNSLNNIIVGNSAANTLVGYDGNDILYGYDGVDSLSGGLGADSLYGGAGNDSFT
ncbi:PA14 domain-containing protein, partial [Devosia sp. LjRoot16]|uniref:PA14 domain-containing protein n=1 Tax=Devosia sp. LjRoot16 TaxID=3342271 RepID=UPI003F507885